MRDFLDFLISSVPRLWPQFVGIAILAAVALLGRPSNRLRQSAVVIWLAWVVYWAVDAPHQAGGPAGYPRFWAGLGIMGGAMALPLVGALGTAGYLTREGARRAAVAGAVAGIGALLVIPLPLVALVVHCFLTGDCL